MKIAWFSPLPPAHSEIANFTHRIVGELAGAFETHFFTETTDGFQEPAAAASYPAPLGHVAQALLPRLNRLDVPIYHLGNNPVFFSHTWFLSQRKPGIVVLHDLKLHHFFEGIYRERLGDQAAYLQWMRREYGRRGYEAGMAYWRQELSIDFMAEHFPMTAWAVRGALGIVVHTAHALATIRTLTDTPAVLAPLTHPPSAQPRPELTDYPPFTPAHRARLLMFGYLNVNRRVVEFLHALAAMPERESFEVNILGTLLHQREVEAAIDALGLRARVTLHGHVAEAALVSALEQADLAVNLRYPSMGEASASQLRLWDHALPSLVTQTEGYADLPADAVFFVRPEHESADIQTHLRHLLANPEAFRAAGRRGRQVLAERHSPSAYVAQIAQLCAEVDLLRSRHSQLALAQRTGEAAASWLEAAPLARREDYYASILLQTV